MEDSVRLRERFKTSYQNLMQDSNTDKAGKSVIIHATVCNNATFDVQQYKH